MYNRTHIENDFLYYLKQILGNRQLIDLATKRYAEKTQLVTRLGKAVTYSEIAPAFNGAGEVNQEYCQQHNIQFDLTQFPENRPSAQEIILISCVNYAAEYVKEKYQPYLNYLIEQGLAVEADFPNLLNTLSIDAINSLYASEYIYDFDLITMQPTHFLQWLLNRKAYQFSNTDIFVSPGPGVEEPPLDKRDPLNYARNRNTLSGFLDGLSKNQIKDVIAVGYTHPVYGVHPDGVLSNCLLVNDFLNYFMPTDRTLLLTDNEGMQHTIESTPITKVGRIITYRIRIDNSSTTILVHHYPLNDQQPLNLDPNELAYVRSIGKKPGNKLTHCRGGLGRSGQIACILAADTEQYQKLTAAEQLAKMRSERVGNHGISFIQTEQQEKFLEQTKSAVNKTQTETNFQPYSNLEFNLYLFLQKLIQLELEKAKTSLPFNQDGVVYPDQELTAAQRKYIELLDFFKVFQIAESTASALRIFNNFFRSANASPLKEMALKLYQDINTVLTTNLDSSVYEKILHDAQEQLSHCTTKTSEATIAAIPDGKMEQAEAMTVSTSSTVTQQPITQTQSTKDVTSPLSPDMRPSVGITREKIIARLKKFEDSSTSIIKNAKKTANQEMAKEIERLRSDLLAIITPKMNGLLHLKLVELLKHKSKANHESILAFLQALEEFKVFLHNPDEKIEENSPSRLNVQRHLQEDSVLRQSIRQKILNTHPLLISELESVKQYHVLATHHLPLRLPLRFKRLFSQANQFLKDRTLHTTETQALFLQLQQVLDPIIKEETQWSAYPPTPERDRIFRELEKKKKTALCNFILALNTNYLPKEMALAIENFNDATATEMDQVYRAASLSIVNLLELQIHNHTESSQEVNAPITAQRNPLRLNRVKNEIADIEEAHRAELNSPLSSAKPVGKSGKEEEDQAVTVATTHIDSIKITTACNEVKHKLKLLRPFSQAAVELQQSLYRFVSESLHQYPSLSKTDQVAMATDAKHYLKSQIDLVHELLFDLKTSRVYLSATLISDQLSLIAQHIRDLILLDDKYYQSIGESSLAKELKQLQAVCSEVVLFREDPQIAIKIQLIEKKSDLEKTKKRLIFPTCIEAVPYGLRPSQSFSLFETITNTQLSNTIKNLYERLTPTKIGSKDPISVDNLLNALATTSIPEIGEHEKIQAYLSKLLSLKILFEDILNLTSKLTGVDERATSKLQQINNVISEVKNSPAYLAMVFLENAERYLKTNKWHNNVVEKQLAAIQKAHETGDYVSAKGEFHRLGETRFKALWATNQVNQYFLLFKPNAGTVNSRVEREEHMLTIFKPR